MRAGASWRWAVLMVLSCGEHELSPPAASSPCSPGQEGCGAGGAGGAGSAGGPSIECGPGTRLEGGVCIQVQAGSGGAGGKASSGASGQSGQAGGGQSGGGQGGSAGAESCESGGCAHGPCEQGEWVAASCSSCAAEVCAHDSYCCSGAWDGLCVAAAEKRCGCDCAQAGASGAGAGGDGGSAGAEGCVDHGECGHSVCKAGKALSKCNGCVEKVCDDIPSCCGGPKTPPITNEGWGPLCVERARARCDCCPEEAACDIPPMPPGDGACVPPLKAFQCNPITGEGCNKDEGEACSFYQNCVAAPATAKLCEPCGAPVHPGCQSGYDCLNGRCAKLCCKDVECGPLGRCSFAGNSWGRCLESTGVAGQAGSAGSGGQGGSAAAAGAPGAGGSAGSAGQGGSAGKGGSGGDCTNPPAPQDPCGVCLFASCHAQVVDYFCDPGVQDAMQCAQFCGGDQACEQDCFQLPPESQPVQIELGQCACQPGGPCEAQCCTPSGGNP